MLTCLLFFVSLSLVGSAPVLWNPATDPLPPNQPKEMGATVSDIQFYTLVNGGAVVLDINVPGYQFNSYVYQTIMATTGGEAEGVPQLQISYNNYKDPSSATASMLAHYATQSCSYGQIEGESPYPGY